MGNPMGTVAREAKAMTRSQVVLQAIEGRITWIQAGQVGK